jgi:hypothetical protein
MLRYVGSSRRTLRCVGLNKALILTVELILEVHLRIDTENIRNPPVPTKKLAFQ